MKHLSNFFLALALCFSISLNAQTPTPIVYILDASGSMWGQIDGKPKMKIARQVLEELLDSTAAEQPMGLVAYGHRKKGDCQDVEYMLAANSTDQAAFKKQLAGIKPLGKTPLAYSAKLVIDDLAASGSKATVILLTDGIETCEGDLCQLVKEARAKGIEFKLHIIGFDLKEEEKEALKCAAEEGGGQYLDAANAEELSAGLFNTSNQTIDKPVPNFLLSTSKNGKLIDAVAKLIGKKYPDELKKRAIRTYSDTAKMYLPPGKHTLSVKVIGSRKSIPAKEITVEIPSANDTIQHLVVAFDAGSVFVKCLSNGKPWDTAVYIKDIGGKKTLTSSRTYAKGALLELTAGSYEVHAKPVRMKGPAVDQVKVFEIKSGKVDTLEMNFDSGEAFIGASHNGALVDATVNIYTLEPSKNIAGGRTYKHGKTNPKKFILQPGKYIVKLKALSADVRGMQKEFEMTIKAGESFRKMQEF